ncbi:UNVERIFIED_ORG: hypothetical protein ABIB19_000256 [Arthrobacter sp. UYEF10]
MDVNPVLRPKLATPALILSSVAVSICVIYVAGTVATGWQSPPVLIVAAAASVLLAASVGAIWFARARRLRAWTAAAIEKWNRLDDLKRTLGTTTEVTVLSVDALEPTGSWITIRWDRFDHVQRAWLEAMQDPIWPGSVLLISPDPAQVIPGAPWPPTYYIQNANFLAWAPLKRLAE